MISGIVAVRSSGAGVQGVVAQRQVVGDLEGGLAHPAAVDLPRREPVLQLPQRSAAAAGLQLDPDLDRVAVRDVHVDRRRPVLPHRQQRRQHPGPRPPLVLGQGGGGRLRGVGVHVEGRQHGDHGLPGHLDVATLPVPVLGGDAVRLRQVLQSGFQFGHLLILAGITRAPFASTWPERRPRRTHDRAGRPTGRADHRRPGGPRRRRPPTGHRRHRRARLRQPLRDHHPRRRRDGAPGQRDEGTAARTGRQHHRLTGGAVGGLGPRPAARRAGPAGRPHAGRHLLRPGSVRVPGAGRRAACHRTSPSPRARSPRPRSSLRATPARPTPSSAGPGPPAGTTCSTSPRPTGPGT